MDPTQHQQHQQQSAPEPTRDSSQSQLLAVVLDGTRSRVVAIGLPEEDREALRARARRSLWWQSDARHLYILTAQECARGYPNLYNAYQPALHAPHRQSQPQPRPEGE